MLYTPALVLYWFMLSLSPLFLFLHSTLEAGTSTGLGSTDNSRDGRSVGRKQYRMGRRDRTWYVVYILYSAIVLSFLQVGLDLEFHACQVGQVIDNGRILGCDGMNHVLCRHNRRTSRVPRLAELAAIALPL